MDHGDNPISPSGNTARGRRFSDTLLALIGLKGFVRAAKAAPGGA